MGSVIYFISDHYSAYSHFKTSVISLMDAAVNIGAVTNSSLDQLVRLIDMLAFVFHSAVLIFLFSCAVDFIGTMLFP